MDWVPDASRLRDSGGEDPRNDASGLLRSRNTIGRNTIVVADSRRIQESLRNSRRCSVPVGFCYGSIGCSVCRYLGISIIFNAGPRAHPARPPDHLLSCADFRNWSQSRVRFRTFRERTIQPYVRREVSEIAGSRTAGESGRPDILTSQAERYLRRTTDDRESQAGLVDRGSHGLRRIHAGCMHASAFVP